MSLIEDRIRAYRYIVEHAREANQDLSKIPQKTLAGVSYISLAELARLRDGTANPTRELVAALKQLLIGVAAEAEIDEYLVNPFPYET